MKRLISSLLIILLLSSNLRAQQILIRDDITATDDSVSLAVPSGSVGFTIDVTGTFVGAIVIQGTATGSWTQARTQTVIDQSDLSSAIVITAPGSWTLPNFGFTHIRALESPSVGWTSGTASITITRGYSTSTSGATNLSGDVTVDLGDLEALLDGVEGSLTAIDGHVDGLEALLTTQAGYLDGLEALIALTNGYVDGLEGFVDGIEAILTTISGNVDGIETLLTSIIGNVDGIEGLLSTISGNVDQLEGYVDGIEALLSTSNTNTGNAATSLDALDNSANKTPADNFANPTGALVVYALTGCWDGSAWDRCTGASADTELPAAAALADDTANPTVPGVAAFLMCFDGSTWDRCPTSDGGSGAASANTSRVIAATDSPEVVSLAILDDWDESDRAKVNIIVGQAGVAAGTGASSATTQRIITATDSPELALLDGLEGSVDGLEGFVDGLEGFVDGLETLIGTTNTNTGNIATYLGGQTLKRYLSAGSTEDESQVKATAGVLIGVSARNAHATTSAFLKCTNLTAANTTPGSSAIFYELEIFALSGFVDRDINATFDTALTCYIVTGKADNDATEVAAGDVSYNLTYR